MTSKIDLSKVKEKLSNLQQKGGGGTGSTDFWKPTEPQTTIRILPYKHNLDYPFIELFFHYSLGRGILSPKSVGKKDPVYEFAKQLFDSGDKNEFNIARQLNPKLRVYAPIIVRGEEDKGVRFWGFSKTIYESLLALIADDDYGDITDVKTGTDIVVEYQSPEEAGNDFGKISVRPKRNVTPLSDDVKQAKEWITNQKDIFELFTVPESDELEEKLKNWLSKDEEKDPLDISLGSNSKSNKAQPKEELEEKEETNKDEIKKSTKTLDDFEKMFEQD